jgi:DNA-3-methyladenine glycosylase I
MKEVPTKTPLSDTISKDLKKRGMTFVGSTGIKRSAPTITA